MIFKTFNLIIFQSLFQAKLFREYNDDIFVDSTNLYNSFIYLYQYSTSRNATWRKITI